MRRMLALACVVLAVGGCKSQKVIAVETELAATKSRLATLDKKRQELNAESKRLQIERKTFSHQADEAALARERLAAAGSVLQGQPIPDGIQLDEALRAKSPKLGELAASIVQRTLPCVDPDAPADPTDYGEGCEAAPLEDPCDGVAARNTQELSFGCDAIVPNGKAPPTAVCLSSGNFEDSTYPLTAPTTYLVGDVVRLAFKKKGRLVVADWPPPSVDLYRPNNWSGLASCGRESVNAQCIRTCDERHGRLTRGCEQWTGGPDGSGEGDEDDPEPYELRAAREAAATADAEAQRASDELSYQECLAQRGGVEEVEPETISRVELSYSRSPAPGLFLFDVEIAGEEDAGVPPHVVLISFPALHDELAGAAEPAEKDSVSELTTSLDVEKLIEGQVVDGKRILAGLTLEGLPTGVRISMDGKTRPEPLELDDVCDFGEHLKNKLFVERCAVAKAQREVAKVKAAEAKAKADAKDAGVDAGIDAGVADAGVTP